MANDLRLFPHLGKSAVVRKDAYKKLWGDCYGFAQVCASTPNHAKMVTMMERLWPEACGIILVPTPAPPLPTIAPTPTPAPPTPAVSAAPGTPTSTIPGGVPPGPIPAQSPIPSHLPQDRKDGIAFVKKEEGIYLLGSDFNFFDGYYICGPKQIKRKRV